jgi:hypothetical protein
MSWKNNGNPDTNPSFSQNGQMGRRSELNISGTNNDTKMRLVSK